MAVSRFIAVFSADPAALYEFAPRLSPKIEICPPDGLLVEVPTRYEQDTVNRLAQLTRNSGARIGGASTRVVAILAAKIQPGTFVPYGREAQFLAPFPIHSLLQYTPVDSQVLATLSEWGIRSLGDLSRLPADSLVARLGRLGERLKKLARGEDEDCFQPLSPRIEFEEKKELEWTLDNLEPLSFVLGAMLEKLCARICERGLAVEQLHITLELTDQSRHNCHIRPAFPMQDPQGILSLARLELQSTPPPNGITAISLEATPTKPRFFQHSLLQPTAPHPEKLSRTLTRLTALVGAENLGSPRLLDTHRPDTFRLEPLDPAPKTPGERPLASPRSAPWQEARKRDRVLGEGEGDGEGECAGNSVDCPMTQLSLRRMRPPEPIRIQTTEIVTCAGPWKSSGDWWMDGGRTDGWSREEWDIEMIDGGIYRVYWDHQKREWFLEGIYD